MRKALLLTTVLAAMGGAALAAQASQDRAPDRDGVEPTTQQDASRKDTDRVSASRDERAHESRERTREEGRQAHEEEEEDDRD